MQNRLLSNVIVLAIVIAGFFGITFALNFFSYNDVEVQQEFSFERRMADKLYARKNWEGSGRYYKQLISADPENGGAVFTYAECIHQDLYSKFRTEKSTEEEELLSNRIGQELIPAYEAAVEFPRYRNLARFRLAMLHGRQGDKREAVEYLVANANDGYYPRKNIKHYPDFQIILDEPEIVELFLKNKRFNPQ